MRRLILETDKVAAMRYAERADRRKYNGHDRPSAYLDGFLAGVRHARRNQLSNEGSKVKRRRKVSTGKKMRSISHLIAGI